MLWWISVPPNLRYLCWTHSSGKHQLFQPFEEKARLAMQEKNEKCVRLVFFQVFIKFSFEEIPCFGPLRVLEFLVHEKSNMLPNVPSLVKKLKLWMWLFFLSWYSHKWTFFQLNSNCSVLVGHHLHHFTLQTLGKKTLRRKLYYFSLYWRLDWNSQKPN